MKVDEYFPEGLSVIQLDESKTESDSKRENSSLEALRNLPEVIRRETGKEVPATVHCHVCYKNISDPINNVDYFKPCNCNLTYVHSSCASKNKSKFGVAKCSSCGNHNTLPKISYRKIETGEFGSPLVRNTRIPKKDFCVICHNQRYQNVRIKTPNIHLINPCFCGVRTHFGCIVPLLKRKTVCIDCGVIYRDFQMASASNFFLHYFFRYSCYILYLSILCTLLLFTFFNSSFSVVRNSYREISCSFLVIILIVVIVLSILLVVWYTLSSALPKYRVCHGKLTVVPYRIKTAEFSKEGEKPSEQPILEKNTEKPEKMSMREVRARLNGVDIEIVEEPRGHEMEDMTLGQYMFGVNTNHQSSSTPIEKEENVFGFSSENAK